VDLDCPEAIYAAQVLLEDTGMVFGRQSKPYSHYFYRCDPPVRSKRYIDPVETDKDEACLVELRCQKIDGTTGLQTVVPPSIHESGEQIRFEKGYDKDPANVDAPVLQADVAKVAAAALLARRWQGEKSGRNAAFIALAGALARGGWPLDQAVAFHRAIYRALWGSHADLEAAKAEVVATYEKQTRGFETTGRPTLEGLVDNRVVGAALAWLEISQTAEQPRPAAHTEAAHTEAPDDWPKPEPTQDELPSVQAFSEALLPHTLRPLVADVAERMQVPMDFPSGLWCCVLLVR
jgi:hypothetical protein